VRAVGHSPGAKRRALAPAAPCCRSRGCDHDARENCFETDTWAGSDALL
jgi:hypothetical protein